MGLPASGKTTFAEEYCTNFNNKNRYNRKSILNICIDKEKEKYYRYNKKQATLSNIIGNLFDNVYSNEYSEVIIDGLFLTNDDIIKVLDIISWTYVNEVEIHYWNPNIEKCLHNDIGRRKENSTITIKNCKLEYPDIEKIKNNTNNTKFKNISVVEHIIIEKPYWKIQADKYGVNIEDYRYLYSDSWSLGGSWGNCWGDSGSVSPDNPPSSFTELDELLEKICPTITFLQYKNIFSQCVEIETRSERDYYGGSVEYAKYRCDLEKLFDLLKDEISEENI